MASEASAQNARLVTKLQSEFTGPDRTNVAPAVAAEIIRQKWSDPMWRQAEAQRVGDVPFVQSAMKAFGLDPSGLKTLQPTPDSAMAGASLGMPTPPGPNDIPSLPTPTPMPAPQTGP